MTPTPAQSDETLQDCVNKILDKYAGTHKPREYSDKIIDRIFDAVDGAIDQMDTVNIRANVADPIGLGDSYIDRAELRAEIKRLREEK